MFFIMSIFFWTELLTNGEKKHHEFFCQSILVANFRSNLDNLVAKCSQAFPTGFFLLGWNNHRHRPVLNCPLSLDLKGCMKRETCATICGGIKDLCNGGGELLHSIKASKFWKINWSWLVNLPPPGPRTPQEIAGLMIRAY